MKILLRLGAVAVTVFVAGCSVPAKSTIEGEKIGYAIPREKAKEIVESSILASFSPDYVNVGPANSLTSSGYVRFVLDTQTVNATAFPVRGVDGKGNQKDGYGFEVTSEGTMPFTGGRLSKRVYDLLKRQAQMSGDLLKLP